MVSTRTRLAAHAVYSEDPQFWDIGVSVEGMQVGLDALSAGEKRPRGGSTITQQLAKNLFVSGTSGSKSRAALHAAERDFHQADHSVLVSQCGGAGPQLYGQGRRRCLFC